MYKRQPLGQTTLETKILETQKAIADGADEIDYVINIGDCLLYTSSCQHAFTEKLATFRPNKEDKEALRQFLMQGSGNS